MLNYKEVVEMTKGRKSKLTVKKEDINIYAIINLKERLG